MENTKKYPQADLYAPGGMARERFSFSPARLLYAEDGDDLYDYDADWRSEDAHLDSLYEDRYDC